MSARDFAPIADSLRRGVIDFYGGREENLSDAAGSNTLETNSSLAERRGRPLLEIYSRVAGRDSIDGLRLLDLGCGFGALSVFFAAQGAQVTGIDPNEARFRVGRAVAAEHGLEIEFARGRMEDLDLSDSSFDLAVQNNSLCYIVPNDMRRAALSETARVLRPGAFLIVRNPNRWHPFDQFTGLPMIHLLPPRQATRLAELLGRERSTVRLTSPRKAISEMREAGFGRVDHVVAPSSNWPAFMKPFARYQHLAAQRPS